MVFHFQKLECYFFQNESDEDLEDVPSTSIIDMIPQASCQNHETQIEVDGAFVYKATVVKNIFCSNPLSRDRLRRIRGMTKFTDSDKTSEAIDSSLMAGDPILVNVKGKLQISKIEVIKRANRKVKFLSVEDLDNQNVQIEACFMKMETIGDQYVWDGSFIGEKLSVLGSCCFAIKPSIKEINGKLTFCFDKQFILDLNVSVTLESERLSHSLASTSNQQSSAKTAKKHLLDCFICKKKVALAAMRKHVGEHILKQNVNDCNTCGFCGRNVCENILKRSSRKAGVDYFKVQSNCPYFVEWKKKPVFSTRNPCTNQLVACSKCNASIWTYNAESHYSSVHPQVEYQSLVSQEEIEKMMK